jgi:hypothetical protein
MKFFDLELGGLGQMVIHHDSAGNPIYVGGTTARSCKKSTKENGKAYMEYVNVGGLCTSAGGSSDRVYVNCTTK